MKSKRWCNVCNFMTYGDCHEEKPRTPPNDVRLTRPSRLLLIPFSPIDIAGNATVNVNAHPQLPGLPLHLEVDPIIAPYFMIEDIKIGKNSQTACYGAMRAGLFLPAGEDKTRWNNLHGIDAFMVGHIITLTVTNRAPHACTFSALMRAQGFEQPPPSLADFRLTDLARRL